MSVGYPSVYDMLSKYATGYISAELSGERGQTQRSRFGHYLHMEWNSSYEIFHEERME